VPESDVPEVPLRKAAQATVGATASLDETIRDMLIVVFVPFIIPAVVLALSRIGHGQGSIFTLGDLSFGFVAVGLAGSARAVSLKSTLWQTYLFAAFALVGVEVALAAATDNVRQANALAGSTTNVARAPSDNNLAMLRELSLDFTGRDPSAWQWAASILLGLSFMTLSFELIRRDR
jgi:hypothetical protein